MLRYRVWEAYTAHRHLTSKQTWNLKVPPCPNRVCVLFARTFKSSQSVEFHTSCIFSSDHPWSVAYFPAKKFAIAYINMGVGVCVIYIYILYICYFAKDTDFLSSEYYLKQWFSILAVHKPGVDWLLKNLNASLDHLHLNLLLNHLHASLNV